jgi:colicin import membrane protein
MVLSKENRYGLFGTITFHAGLLLLLLFVWFTAYPPLTGEEGITVNFGDSETGLGDIEPSPAISQEEPTQTVKQEEVPAAVPPASSVKEKTKPLKEEVETQDLEKTAALEAAKKTDSGNWKLTDKDKPNWSSSRLKQKPERNRQKITGGFLKLTTVPKALSEKPTAEQEEPAVVPVRARVSAIPGVTRGCLRVIRIQVITARAGEEMVPGVPGYPTA